ncbi:MAG: hypothetical protein QXW00_00875 [Candidatus Woesearchaeota archaeon]
MLFAVPLLVGVIAGLVTMLFAGSNFFGSQKAFLFFFVLLVSFACAFLSVNSGFASEFLRASFLQNALVVQALSAVVAGVLALVVVYVVGMFSGGAMLMGGTSFLIVFVNAALVFAAPYLVAFVPLGF